jgi:TetR/AcrR family fatty acid metabolism transcriptional regulator
MAANTKVQAFKKTLIIETAKELFTQNSFEAVTVEEIAKSAGFGKSTVYLFFENKEEILHTVIKMGLEQLSVEFQKIAEEETDLKQALEMLIPLQYGYFLEYGSLLFTYVQKKANGNIKAEWYEEIERIAVPQKTAHLSHILKRGMQEEIFITGDPDYFAWLVTSMIKGVCMPSILMKPEMRDQEKDIGMLQTLILNGILLH